MNNRTVTVRSTDIVFLERGCRWFRKTGGDMREVEVTDPNLMDDLSRLRHSGTINIDGKPYTVIVSTVLTP